MAISSSANSDGGLISHWNYVDGNEPDKTTSLVKDMSYKLRQDGNYSPSADLKFSYAYDDTGNITDIKDKNDALIVHYEYNKLNQLKRENNVATGETVVYTYDFVGNITKKEIYAYTDGALPQQPQNTINYGYDSGDWKDKLVSYMGQTITYDGIGNPLNYRDGWEFEWTRGSKLDKMLKNGYNIVCKYDDGGIRTEKVVNNVKTEFITDGMQILAQKTGDNTIIWQIDENGSVLGFLYNNTQYYYLKNAQGDIVAIADAAGIKVVDYVYDSWGKLISISDTSGCNIGEINPLRYRGYYYDSETGLYYLNARYYDPETGRFLNADDNLEGGLNLLIFYQIHRF